MVFFDDKAATINDLIDAIIAVEEELGLTPAGIYASVRTRLDILEARINNPNLPAPNAENPFFIGNTGVTMSTGFGAPTENRIPGSLYLREDGYNNQGLYALRPDGYWHQINTDNVVWVASGDLAGTTTSQIVIGIQGNPISNTTPTTNQVLAWNGSNWTPTTVSGTPKVRSAQMNQDFKANTQTYTDIPGLKIKFVATSTAVKLFGGISGLLIGFNGATVDVRFTVNGSQVPDCQPLSHGDGQGNVVNVYISSVLPDLTIGNSYTITVQACTDNSGGDMEITPINSNDFSFQSSGGFLEVTDISVSSAVFPSVAGILAHWRSDLGATDNGSFPIKITSLADQSGNGNTASGTASLFYPRSGTNGRRGIVSGSQGGVGSNGRLSVPLTTASRITSTDITLFAVIRTPQSDAPTQFDTRNPPYTLIGDTTNSSPHNGFGISSGHIAYVANSNTPIVGSINIADELPHVLCLTQKGSNGAVSLYVDGVLDTTGTGNNSYGFNALGNGVGQGDGFLGEMLEWAAYNSVLSFANIQSITNAMLGIWGW